MTRRRETRKLAGSIGDLVRFLKGARNVPYETETMVDDAGRVSFRFLRKDDTPPPKAPDDAT